MFSAGKRPLKKRMITISYKVSRLLKSKANIKPEIQKENIMRTLQSVRTQPSLAGGLLSAGEEMQNSQSGNPGTIFDP